MTPSAWRRNRRTWHVAEPYRAAEDLARKLGTAPLVAQILANRGITDPEAAKAFMAPSLSELHDPQELPGSQQAAERIARAVRDEERIVLYGDYDVDGITGLAILHSCLRMVGANVECYVPHRLEEGYGVNAEAVAKFIRRGADLMITVDCGITAAGPLSQAAAAGLDVIVTDHHAPGQMLPEAAAIVHPSLPGSDYPNPDLAGAGVAFKLAWQTARTICGSTRVDERMRDFLLDATCLAALGTIADVVPLLGENRCLAVHGLRGLPASSHPGLRALIDSAGLANEKLDAYHVGFVLAPRLNAAGRMGHARLAVELLTEAPPERCRQIAEYLAGQNAERRQIQKQITEQAVEMVQSRGLAGPDRMAIVLWSEQWHGGVIGIVASRLVEMFSRPVVLVAIDGQGCGQGSARSIAGFDMRAALSACSRHLESFGGHAMAGGLRVAAGKIEAFAEAFARHAGQNMSPEQLRPSLKVDAETTLAALSYNVAQHIAKLAPFGQGNPRPLVAARNCRVLVPPKRMGRNGATASLMLSQQGARIRAVGFGMGQLADELVGVGSVDVVGQPVLNSFNGRDSVELRLADVKWD